jgi:hypothetical protein
VLVVSAASSALPTSFLSFTDIAERDSFQNCLKQEFKMCTLSSVFQQNRSQELGIAFLWDHDCILKNKQLNIKTNQAFFWDDIYLPTPQMFLRINGGLWLKYEGTQVYSNKSNCETLWPGYSQCSLQFRCR